MLQKYEGLVRVNYNFPLKSLAPHSVYFINDKVFPTNRYDRVEILCSVVAFSEPMSNESVAQEIGNQYRFATIHELANFLRSPSVVQFTTLVPLVALGTRKVVAGYGSAVACPVATSVTRIILEPAEDALWDDTHSFLIVKK